MSEIIQQKTINALPVQGMADLEHAGKILSQCEILGAGNPAEGFFIATVCHQTGQSYQEWLETYSLIHGSPSMKADAMLARFNAFGGKHNIIERSPEKVSFELDFDGKKNIFSLTWDEAKEEPFPYRGKESVQLAELQKPFEQRNLKDKYKTPRSRMQMLWARLVSDSVRAVCPQANKGTYSRDEVEDFAGEEKELNAPPPQAVNPSAVSDIQVVCTESVAMPSTQTDAVQEETPFDEPDYTICPVKGCPLTGKKWAEIDDENLNLALGLEACYGVTDNHKLEINKVLESRKA